MDGLCFVYIFIFSLFCNIYIIQYTIFREQDDISKPSLDCVDGWECKHDMAVLVVDQIENRTPEQYQTKVDKRCKKGGYSDYQQMIFSEKQKKRKNIRKNLASDFNKDSDDEVIIEDNNNSNICNEYTDDDVIIEDNNNKNNNNNNINNLNNLSDTDDDRFTFSDNPNDNNDNNKNNKDNMSETDEERAYSNTKPRRCARFQEQEEKQKLRDSAKKSKPTTRLRRNRSSTKKQNNKKSNKNNKNNKNNKKINKSKPKLSGKKRERNVNYIWNQPPQKKQRQAMLKIYWSYKCARFTLDNSSQTKNSDECRSEIKNKFKYDILTSKEVGCNKLRLFKKWLVSVKDNRKLAKPICGRKASKKQKINTLLVNNNKTVQVLTKNLLKPYSVTTILHYMLCTICGDIADTNVKENELKYECIVCNVWDHISCIKYKVPENEEYVCSNCKSSD